MKKKSISILLLLISISVFSQRANLDRAYFNVSYVSLPSKPIIDSEKRTFSANKNALSIAGFTKVKSGGNVDVDYTFNGTTIGEVDINKTKHEKKDKDGNVTSVSYTYQVIVPYESTANVSIVNSVNPENNFQTQYKESDTYKSKSFDTYTKAKNHYNNNKYTIRNDHRTKHKNAFIKSINGYLASTYGYIVKKHRDQFWILGTKKHPEFEHHKALFDKANAVFDKMKSNQPVDQLKAEFEPIIQEFESIVPKYQGTKKRERKMRYASYYNIAQIYYYMDMPEKAKEYAQKIIDNDYDKGDGKKMNRWSDALLKKFKANKTTSRHMEVVTKNLSNEPDEEEEEAAPASTPSNELSKAYLISKESDTLMVDVLKSNLNSIGYDIKTATYDTSGNIIGSKVVMANKCKEVLFVDGTHYKNINFKESSLKEGAVSGSKLLAGSSEKLCKVLFESEKIGLYLFDNKETVIVPAGSEKGKSTLSTGYVFGFKKNLSKLAAGCPTLLDKVKKKEFKNNKEDLLKFCEELSSCQ